MANEMVLRPQNFDQLMRFADMAASSSMVPMAMRNKPADIMLAVQMGSEVGLAPMQAIQNIAVINGRPSLWGDAMLGLCKMHPAWGGIKEVVEGDGDTMQAVCIVARKGDSEVTAMFSVADAKKAGLWGKQGPWVQYPKRMLQMRARGFALRDAFPDALRGLISAEEAQDMPADTFKGTTIEARVEPPEPINTAPPADQPKTKRTWKDVIAEINVLATAAADEAAVMALGNHALVGMVNEKAGQAVKDEVNAILGEAYTRVVEANMQRADEPVEE